MLRKWILNSIIQDRPARKPIAHLSRIESLPGDSQVHGHFKLACISDKEKFIRAVFTKDSLCLFEQEGTKLDDIRGGLISLQDYAFISSVGTDRRFSEYFIEIHKFHFIGGERNMPIPTVTNINLDETVQSKLAQLWREQHMDNRTHNDLLTSLRVYSQTEDAPQLSQDELSMLLVAMSEQSQVDSIEAISSSQIFELENIPGWMKPERDTQMEEQVLTQEIEYYTPLVEESPIITMTRRSHEDTPASDGTFQTPPEGLTPPIVTNNGLDHQQGMQTQPMIDIEEPLMPSHSSAVDTSLRSGEAIGGSKEIGEILEQAVENVCKILSQSNPLADEALADIFSDDVEISPVEYVYDEDVDDFALHYEISDSQTTDLNAIWMNDQHSLLVTSASAAAAAAATTMGQQPCSSDSLYASATPNNSYNYRDNYIINNGCAVHRVTTSSSGQPAEGDQQRVKLGTEQQPTAKGKGGTTKDIHRVEKLYNTTSQYDDAMDDDISISSSQRDELDSQWVAAIDDVDSSLETLEDLHPFQLTDPRKKRDTSNVQHPLTKTHEDKAGPSGVVIVTTATGSEFILNQEARGRDVVSQDGMDLDTSDQYLLSQAETVTSPTTTAKTMQTSLVSTGAITRLLDVSNKLPPVIGCAVGDKTIPQSSAATSNTRLTPSRTMSSTHNGAQLGNSKLNPDKDRVSHKKTAITTSNASDYSNDIEASEECLNSYLANHFKPLTNEEEIDDFIDGYWTLQQLRAFSL